MKTSENLMKKFLSDRKNLSSITNYVAYSENGRPHLTIGHPAILATFIGYLKYSTRNTRRKEIFFRGQTNDHPQVIPSLLRGKDFDRINNLSLAYEELKKRVKEKYTQTRFKHETIDNIFQHYGIKSKTLDLVDNIYVAIWFATNSWKKINGLNNLCTYHQSQEEYGWIYFMEVEAPRATTKSTFSNPGFTGYCDLRKFHSSLSARLHCQHGITYFRNNKGLWTEENRDFNNVVIAAVKFPNTEEFRMNGTLFTKEFLFPNSQIDNTYKILAKKEFADLLHSIEYEFNLKKEELGKIWIYNF